MIPQHFNAFCLIQSYLLFLRVQGKGLLDICIGAVIEFSFEQELSLEVVGFKMIRKESNAFVYLKITTFLHKLRTFLGG
jgi:hypothetical protein